VYLKSLINNVDNQLASNLNSEPRQIFCADFK